MELENKNIGENQTTETKSEADSTDAHLAPEEAQPKKRSWKKIILYVLLTVVLIILALAAWLYIGLSGGINGAIMELKPAPDPNSTELVSKRRDAKLSIENNLSQIEDENGLSAHTEASENYCEEGQHNWKIVDDFAHMCTIKVSRIYGFNGDFRQKLIDFEDQAINLGWEPSYGSGRPIKDIMANYYDQYYGPDNPKPRNFPDSYLVSDLPTPSSGYTKDDRRLYVEYAESNTKDLFQIEYALYGRTGVENMDKLFADITNSNEYVLVVSIEEVYFQN